MSPLHDRSEEKRTGQCCGADEDLNPIPIHADYFQRLTPGQQLDELVKPNGSTINYATNRSSNRPKLESFLGISGKQAMALAAAGISESLLGARVLLVR